MKKTMQKMLLALLMSCTALLTYAQQRTVTGTVMDEKGAPMPNVSYQLKGTTTGGITADDGTFSVSADNNSILEFSAVGYTTQNITVGTNTSLNIVMRKTEAELETVVVTALGIRKDDKKLGYAVTKLSGEDLTRTNTVNPITGLQGKVAGVNINVMSANGVQSSPFIQIRGAKVLGGPGNNQNQPIFVIDGNIVNNNIADADNTDAGSQLKNLNPDDYESITVLKGAAATSLYGSRGLNGAIVITTKKGKRGQGLGIELNSTYQVQKIYKSPMDYQDIYGQGSWVTREGNFAADGTQARTMGSWGPKMDGSMHPAVSNFDKLVPYSPQPDNWKIFYQDGAYINNNVALSGASDKFNYRLSYSNNHTKGMLPNNGMDRNSLDLKVGGDLNKVFSTEFGASYSNTVAKNFYSQGRYYYSGGQNLGFNTYYLPRNIDTKDWYDTYRAADNTVDNAHAYGNLSAVTAAFSRFDKNNYYRHENSVLSYLQLKAQVTPWLDLTARGNINFYKIFTEEKNLGNGTNNSGGYYASGGEYNTDYTAIFMGHVVKQVNQDFNVDFKVVNEIYGNRQGERWGASTNGGLSVPNQFFLGNSANNIQNNYYYGQWIGDIYAAGVKRPSTLTVGLAGILNLAYKNFLNLELTGRNDWLSTLTYPNNVTGAVQKHTVFYPSANASYSFFDHFADQNPDWLSSGRLRASLAYVGNAGIAGPYTTGRGYAPSTIINQNGQSVGVANQFNASLRPNLALKPQVQRSIELGTNFGILRELINVDFAWYKTNTKDQLIQLAGVPETGYSSYFLNAGDIQNKGWELLVNVNPVRNKDWNWSVAVNMGHNKSKVKRLGNGVTQWELSGGYDGANVYAYEGGDFGVLVAETWASAKKDVKTGLPLVTVGGRQTAAAPNQIDFQLYEYVPLSDSDPRPKLGKIEPDLTGGVTTNLRWKNFSLFAQVDGRFGGYVYSEAYNYAMAQGTPSNSLQWRDQEHGGVQRTDSYNGQTRYDGAIPNVVFDEGQMSPLKPGTSIAGMTFREAYDQGLVEPWKSSAYHIYSYGWGTNLNVNESVSKNSWVMLREINLGYRIPNSIVDKVHLRGARISISARNIGYLYKTLSGDQNPESLQSNDPFRPYITGGVPYYRNFAATLNITL